MTLFILLITIALYVILGVFICHNLYNSAKGLRIPFALIGIIVMGIITLIVFNISKNGVRYENMQMMADVRKMLVLLFTPINGLVVLPYLAYLVNKIKDEDITQDEFKKRTIVLTIIFLIILVFECSYLKSTQEGILKVFESL